MLLGVMSDSHGRAETTRRAVDALVGAGADLLIHLGDVGTDAVIDAMVPHTSRIVFGNCDSNADALADHARAAGVIVDHPMGRLEVAGRRIAFTHGHLPRLLQTALAERVDYLLYGHSHQLADDREGGTRLINPGALFRAARYTAVVLDPARDRLQVLDLS